MVQMTAGQQVCSVELSTAVTIPHTAPIVLVKNLTKCSNRVRQIFFNE